VKLGVADAWIDTIDDQHNLNDIDCFQSQSLAFGSRVFRKPFFFADQGALMPPAAKPAVVARAPNLTTVDLDGGTPYLQEDHPHTIGENLATWINGLPAQP